MPPTAQHSHSISLFAPWGYGWEGVAAAAPGASPSWEIAAAMPALSGKSLNVSAELNQMLIPCGERICWNLQVSSWQQENALIHSQICFGQAGCDLDCKAAFNHKVLRGSQPSFVSLMKGKTGLYSEALCIIRCHVVKLWKTHQKS